MDFEVLGEISDIEVIAAGRGIRDLPRLRRLYGDGRWRKMKGSPGSGCRIVRFGELNFTGMKRTASARRKSRPSGTSTKDRRFVVCVRNNGYAASLEQNKIYIAIPDEEAERHGQLRVIDESGEDYLFSADRFVAIEAPAAVRASVLRAS